MPVIAKKPTSPGSRGMVLSDFSDITKKQPEKSLTVRIKRTGGRNNTGRISVAHRGGGAKKIYRLVDFKRDVEGTLTVLAIEYDPNRSANIALVSDESGKKSYILATSKMKVGQKVISGEGIYKDGSQVKLVDLPTATFIHNIEVNPGTGAKLCRSAGAYASFLGLDGKYAIIKLPSGETRKLLGECLATIGVVGNIDHNKVVSGKAGRTRHLGRRPHVRGKAMNPVDHPHGGGEGNTSIGMPGPKTPWGLPTLGYKTRKKKNRTDNYILKKRSTKKR